ncbi:MAG: Fe-S cluster assembly ATPase SufC [Candidatus Azosocius agrarius]|nr:MAG: Fe-S cluster assembly ATPase SufC [Gammaproteobacteria bacterium]
MTYELLKIKNLTVKLKNKLILSNINLIINSNEVHAIMGPNGSGKTTLSKALIRHPDYTTEGEIIYKNKNILTFSPEKCAQEGIFLSFQNPISIPGVTNIQFIKSSINAIKKYKNEPLLDITTITKIAKEKLQILNMPEEFLYRSVNEGFSGGEKKKNEILQMLILNPDLIILDEIDSGLDIDALKTISNIINIFKKNHKSIIIITHYKKVLEYIIPNYIHILKDGKIIHTGNNTLAEKLEECGYNLI